MSSYLKEILNLNIKKILLFKDLVNIFSIYKIKILIFIFLLACNVYYLNTVNVGSKSGFEAISFALNHTKAFLNKDSTQLLLVQFKVTSLGITLTDINKKKFIRQHYATNTVFYCAVDEKICWPKQLDRIQKPRYNLFTIYILVFNVLIFFNLKEYLDLFVSLKLTRDTTNVIYLLN